MQILQQGPFIHSNSFIENIQLLEVVFFLQWKKKQQQKTAQVKVTLRAVMLDF